VRDTQLKWNEAYRIPNAETIELAEDVPQDLQHALPIAEKLAPVIVEKLKRLLF